MDPKCPVIMKFCRTRATLLDSDGAPDVGSDAQYVSDKMISLAITPDILAATRQTVTNGCLCVLASDPGEDKLLGYTLELVSGAFEPAMLSLLLGSTPIMDEVDGTQIIGVNDTGDDLFSCSITRQYVAFEGWAEMWDGAGTDPDLPWLHLVWPKVKWQRSPLTVSGTPANPGLTGRTFQNSEWGSGPYDDVPNDGTTPILIDFFAQWLTDDDPPTASCALQAVS